MPVEDLFKRKATQVGEPTAWEGAVYANVSSLSEKVKVKLNDFESRKYFECRWMSRHDASGSVIYPSEGDDALVVMTDESDAWMIAWWPYA